MCCSKKLIEKELNFGAHNYNPLPVVISKAKGCWVWDKEGRRFLDMLAAYSALNHGHRNPAIIAALKKQLNKVTLTSRAFHNELLGEFLESICKLTRMEMALPMNSGVEAVETAIKAARRWGYKVKGVPTNKAEIIVCKGNFHGRTTTVVGFSSEEQYKEGFGPFCPGFKIIPFNNAEALSNAINENTVAFLFEPIQGESGINIPDKHYLSDVRRICSENNVLMIADEVQTGFGRTGKVFACYHENVQPDVFIIGKSLGGGVLPVSAVVSSKEVLGVFDPGSHGSTFGGNPLACAVGIASIKELQKRKLSENSEKLGKYFKHRLLDMNSPYVKEIRGKGLFIGVEIKREYGKARLFCEKLMQQGILCKETHEQVIRFTPPLIISKKEIDWAMKRIEKVLCK